VRAAQQGDKFVTTHRLRQFLVCLVTVPQVVALWTHIAFAQDIKEMLRTQSQILKEQTRALSGVIDQLDDAQKSARVARGFPSEDLKWPSNHVPVCWEKASSDTEKERAWVRDAVEKSWQAHSALRFLGWQQCVENSEGVRIGVDDVGPYTVKLGKELDGLPNGMVLNFTFKIWSPVCAQSEAQRESCIRSLAVHAFGHAIGFGHTHNRPDTPTECDVQRQGSIGINQLTPWDLKSVMNYCNPVFLNSGVLSEYDVISLQLVYGPPSKAD
jgi:hypothetical protein